MFLIEKMRVLDIFVGVSNISSPVDFISSLTFRFGAALLLLFDLLLPFCSNLLRLPLALTSGDFLPDCRIEETLRETVDLWVVGRAHSLGGSQASRRGLLGALYVTMDQTV